MGADIHVYIEKKTDEKYNIWEAVQLYKIDNYSHKLEVVSPYDGRNYELFSILAGVRGWLDPFVDLRGLPENLSQEVEKESAWWGKEAHSHTWYDIYELKILIKEFKLNNEEDPDCKDVIAALEFFYGKLADYLDFAGEWYFDNEINKYRVIMWFDN